MAHNSSPFQLTKHLEILQAIIPIISDLPAKRSRLRGYRELTDIAGHVNSLIIKSQEAQRSAQSCICNCGDTWWVAKQI
jgi:hypothetical protein